jgi:hypothetical protein
LLVRQDPEAERRGDRGGDLGHDVRRHVLPVEPLAHGQTDGDGRVEVSARHVTDGVRHRDHGQAEGQGDAVEADVTAGEDGCAAAAEDQPERPECLGRESLGERVHDLSCLSPE